MRERELMIRFRNGELEAGRARQVERRLRDDPEFRERYDRLERLARGIEASAAASFGPYFVTRVMARVRTSVRGGPEGLYEALRWMFARVAVAGVLVALSLGVYSASVTGLGGSLVESVLGLPEATVETAVTLGG